ncbi:MAG: pyridoxamine 5'-phosphate oxidase family protein [Anaerolineae bacterium]|nr:pyridoxamine 5'-phosphate oxidase family protein [Anaerolineae bacterium]
MTDRNPIDTRNLDIYGNPPLPWSRPRDLLAAAIFFGRPAFLGTVRPDGRPHAAAIAPLWLAGEIYFTSGPGTRKARDLAHNPACTLSASLATIDLVLEGEALRVTDAPTLERLAARCREGGWPVQVAGDGFTGPYSAPSAGPPPWHLYRFRFHTAIGNATAEPNGATLWRFEC